MEDSRPNIPVALAVGLVCLILFLAGTWDQGYIGFETRFALFAKEMFINGPGWFPTTYGQPYPDYPSMSTFLIYLVACVFGGVNKFVAVLPTATCSAITISLGYHMLSRYDKQWAFYCVLMFLLTMTFITEARAISLDQSIATISIGTFYLVWRAEGLGKSSMPWLIWPLLVLGFSIRGPLGVVIPSTGIVVFYVFRARWRKLIIYGVVSVLLLAALWLLLLTLAKSVGGDGFVDDVIQMQIGGRIDGGRSPEYYYYFTGAFGNYAFAYPFAIAGYAVILYGAYGPGRRLVNEQEKLVVLMGVWVLVILLGLSIPATKKARYLLSMTFPLSVIASYLMYQHGNGVFRYIRRLYIGIISLLPGLLAIVLLFAKKMAVKNGIDPADYPIAGVTLTLLVLQVVLVAWAVYGRRKQVAFKGELSIAVLAFWLVMTMIIEPAEIQIRDSRQFVLQAEMARQELSLPLAFYKVNADALGKVYAVNADQLLYPDFLTDQAGLGNFPKGAFLVTRPDNLSELQAAGVDVKLVMKGSMDNEPFLALAVTPRPAL